MDVWPRVEAPILFVRCEGIGGHAARVAISSTWFGVERGGAIEDATVLLVIQYPGGELNRERMALLDRELVALSRHADGHEILRGEAPNIHAALEEAVPAATRFLRAGFAGAIRMLTLEGPARARLQRWAAVGGNVLPADQ